MDKKLYNLLLKSFDTDLSEKERQQLEDALKSPELQREKERLEQMRSALSGQSAPSFGPFFSERVVNRVRDLSRNGTLAQDFFDSLIYMFRRFALVGGLAACLLFSANLITRDASSTPQTSAADQSIEESVYTNYSISLEEVL